MPSEGRAIGRCRGIRFIQCFALTILFCICLEGHSHAGISNPSHIPGPLLYQQASGTVGVDYEGNAALGRALFTGEIPLSNGGPACAACHSTANLGFPKGGTMAPDLTHEYAKLGPEGMHYALRTLYFPAMNALFLKHQLTPQEEINLSAFFQEADRSQPETDMTGVFTGLAFLGLCVLVGITWNAGRGRVHSVRRSLLKRAGILEGKR